MLSAALAVEQWVPILTVTKDKLPDSCHLSGTLVNPN